MLYRILFLLFPFALLQALSPTDSSAIRQILEDQASSWNREGCKGFGKDYSENASFVNIFGMMFSGAEEIENRHLHILQTFLRGSKFSVDSVSFREIQADTVIVWEEWSVEGFRMPGDDPTTTGKKQTGIFTHVFVKKNDRWQIESSQNTLHRNPNNRQF